MTGILTLQSAKDFLKTNWEKGCACPACSQHVQLYKRKLNSGMAETLIHLYKECKRTNDYIHVKDFLRVNRLKNNHDWTLLKYWGLIEEKESEEKNSGFYKVTDKGKAFVENKITVAKHIYLYNGKRYRMNNETEKISIRESMGEHFSYDELMGVLK